MRHSVRQPGGIAVYTDEFEGCWRSFNEFFDTGDCQTKVIYLPNLPTEQTRMHGIQMPPFDKW
jgi:hypothetical protein